MILRSTSSAASSIKTAESGSLLDIFSCPALSPKSMWWDKMMGLFLILAASQYSRASMLTLRWSTPSWQMSALRKKTSVHCMSGYKIWAAVRFPSSRPIIWQHFLMRVMLNRRATSSIWGQYLSAFWVISSDAHLKTTCSRFIPAAFQTSIRYFPTVLIFSKSPPILSFIRANQSATQKTKVELVPSAVHLLTFIALNTPWAICILPDGSNPSYRLIPFGFPDPLPLARSNFLSSAEEMHSSPTERIRSQSAWSSSVHSRSSLGGASGML